ncbi:unnamed protein product [Arabidopsis halleri]
MSDGSFAVFSSFSSLLLVLVSFFFAMGFYLFVRRRVKFLSLEQLLCSSFAAGLSRVGCGVVSGLVWLLRCFFCEAWWRFRSVRGERWV